MWHIKGIKPALQFPDLIGRKSGIKFSITFTEDMKYTEPDNEGADFRKLTGVSLNRFNYHKDACLIGWRYWEGKFQLVPYFHFGEERVGFDHKVGSFDGYFNNKEIQYFDVGDTIEGEIQFSGGLWVVTIEGATSWYAHFSKSDRGFRVLTWFGGTCNPSHTFYLPLYIK